MPGGLRPPFDVVASWSPNYTNPETSGQGIVILTIILLAATYVVVIMRLWARLYLSKNRGIDDALIVFNMVPLTCLAVAVILAIDRYGFNRHVWDSVPVPTLVNARKVTMVLEELFIISTVTTKISILLFHRRLEAGTITNRYIYCVHAAIAFVVLYFIIFSINILNICKPFDSFWKQADYAWLFSDDNLSKFKCQNEAAALIAAAIISSIQDFIAFGLPIVLLWRLRIPKRQRLALAMIFAVGFFLCICSVLRVVYIIRIYFFTYDMTWESQPAWMWFTIEAHVAVICASAPALKVFFRETLGKSLRHKRSGESVPENSAPSLEEGSQGTIKKKDLW